MSMSVTGAPRRRVRHQAREALLVMLFSASVSVGLALALLVLMTLAHDPGPTGVTGR